MKWIKARERNPVNENKVYCVRWQLDGQKGDWFYGSAPGINRIEKFHEWLDESTSTPLSVVTEEEIRQAYNEKYSYDGAFNTWREAISWLQSRLPKQGDIKEHFNDIANGRDGTPKQPEGEGSHIIDTQVSKETWDGMTSHFKGTWITRLYTDIKRIGSI